VPELCEVRLPFIGVDDGGGVGRHPGQHAVDLFGGGGPVDDLVADVTGEQFTLHDRVVQIEGGDRCALGRPEVLVDGLGDPPVQVAAIVVGVEVGHLQTGLEHGEMALRSNRRQELPVLEGDGFDKNPPRPRPLWNRVGSHGCD
jgi:hypothetical protein